MRFQTCSKYLKKMGKKYQQVKAFSYFLCRNNKNYHIDNIFCLQKTKKSFVLSKVTFSKYYHTQFLLAGKIENKSYYWLT
jgi:hypothetical protein